MKNMVFVDLWCLKMSRSTLWDWWIGRSNVRLPSFVASLTPPFFAHDSVPWRHCATAKQCSKPLNGHGGKRWCGAAVLFLFFLSCSIGPSWTILFYKSIVQNDSWISKWLLSILYCSLFRCYKFTGQHLYKLGHLRSSASRLLQSMDCSNAPSGIPCFSILVASIQCMRT